MLGTIKKIKQACQINWRLAHLKWIVILHTYCEVENCGRVTCLRASSRDVHELGCNRSCHDMSGAGSKFLQLQAVSSVVGGGYNLSLRGVEVRDDGPTLAPGPHTLTVGVCLPSVKERRVGVRDNTLRARSVQAKPRQESFHLLKAYTN